MAALSNSLVRCAVVALLGLGLSACGSSADTRGNGDIAGNGRNPEELVLATVPDESSSSVQTEYEPLAKLLERETGRKVRVEKATTYASVIEGQRAGKIDIAMHGPLSYVAARRSGVALTPVAAQVEAKGDSSGYRSYAIVKRGSKLDRVADFKGRKICFVDPTSTSGYLYPMAGLQKAGVKEKDLQPVMAGGHDASALAVRSGQCDGGFAYDAMVDKLLVERGSAKAGDFEVIWKSEQIPGSPLTVSDELAPELKKKIVETFRNKANADYLEQQGFCEGEGCKIDGYWGFVPTDDADFESVRDVCRLVGEEQCVADQ
ncbi:phosphate/phosphite/phosphonate ABC transporter substrate-binding protein [Streptomyces viridochromogenes]|uniref:phosphate/phosphite/phosphonate ABC transporter substrate-binding protein n=1 Tax=Streptomyces viridochromogenes TaxID=1938 RepID=UPI00069FE9B5|nr:phosphate/phosphite/phosphonate ABC transporter substrate-binding protein [Streptomyces viridochromogenes]KOG08634.1 phosphate starvation-inducible protein PhoH [Streptomyces viridochromogenes]KOG08687.1 phosphate starvation-inducible protein PhoH [Streptomyces viridochromogenes]